MIALPNKKYNIIYADPPWKATKSGTGLRGTSDLAKRYNGVMTVDEICAMPIQDICEDDCILFLWATFPQLEGAMKTMTAWGFKYYGLGFNWVKLNTKTPTPFWGMGYYTRQNPEICLIATKGKQFKPLVRNVQAVVMTPREEHSKKPDVIREHIVNIIGDVPRVELFARQSSEGWDVWGNESDKFDKRRS